LWRLARVEGEASRAAGLLRCGLGGHIAQAAVSRNSGAWHQKDRREVAAGRCSGLTGQNMVDEIRQIGMSEVTYYRWRQEFGGLKIEQVKRLKDLELGNSRLRKGRARLHGRRPYSRGHTFAPPKSLAP